MTAESYSTATRHFIFNADEGIDWYVVLNARCATPIVLLISKVLTYTKSLCTKNLTTGERRFDGTSTTAEFQHPQYYLP